jgi:hypothetical protein
MAPRLSLRYYVKKAFGTLPWPVQQKECASGRQE